MRDVLEPFHVLARKHGVNLRVKVYSNRHVPLTSLLNDVGTATGDTVEEQEANRAADDVIINSLIDIDKAKITQVLSNLLSNAFKFTPKEGTCTVTLHLSDRLGREATEQLPLEPLDMKTLTAKTAAALLRGNLHKHNHGKRTSNSGMNGKGRLSERVSDLLEIKAQTSEHITGDRDNDFSKDRAVDVNPGRGVMNDINIGSQEKLHCNSEANIRLPDSEKSFNDVGTLRRKTTIGGGGGGGGSVSNLTKAPSPSRAETMFRNLRPDKLANHMAMFIVKKKRIFLDESSLLSVDEAEDKQRIASQMKFFVISVTDNGVGIAPEDVTKVFHSVVQFKYVDSTVACAISLCFYRCVVIVVPFVNSCLLPFLFYFLPII